MKRKILVTACAIPLLFCTTANSEVYVSSSMGLAMLNDSDTDLFSLGFPVTITFESKEGLGLGLAVGYTFGNLRVEGEYAYQQNDLETLTASVMWFSTSQEISGETSSNSFLCNFYYDFKNTSSFAPFLSAGIGVSNVEVELLGESEDDSVFAFQLGAGVGYALTDKISLDLKYRYFGTENPEFDGFETEYSSHNIYVGARFYF